MKQTIKKMLLALMVSIGMMGAVSVQAQEKVMVRVSGLCHSDRGCFDNGEAFCDAVIAGIYERRPGWEWSGSRVVCNIQHEIFGAFTAGVIVQCPKGWVDQSRFGCYEQQTTCPAGTVNKGGVCVEPEKQCWEGSVKDKNGNCVCPEDQDMVGFQRCAPKCSENQERDSKGNCVCSFGFVDDGNGGCACPEGFEAVTRTGEQSISAQQCVPKCDVNEVRKNGVCVGRSYDPYQNPAVCGKTSPQTDGTRDPDLGAVACSGSNRGVCFWPESHINQDTKRPDWDDLDLVAQGIIQSCVVEHETVHYNDTGYCNAYSRWGNPTEEKRLDSERRAYEAERACYIRGIDRCESNEACIKDIANEMSLVEQNLEALK